MTQTQTATAPRTPAEQGALFRADLEQLGAPPHIADQMVATLESEAAKEGRDLLIHARLALIATIAKLAAKPRPTLN